MLAEVPIYAGGEVKTCTAAGFSTSFLHELKIYCELLQMVIFTMNFKST